MTDGVINFGSHAASPYVDLLCGILADQPDTDYAFTYQGKAFCFYTRPDGMTEERYEVLLAEVSAMPASGEEPEMVEAVAVFWCGEDGFVQIGECETLEPLSAQAKGLLNAFLSHATGEVQPIAA